MFVVVFSGEELTSESSSNVGEEATPDQENENSISEPITEEQQRKEAEELLKSHSELFKTTRKLWENRLLNEALTGQTLQQHLEEINQSYHSYTDKNFSLSIVTEFGRKAGEYLVTSGCLPILCDVVVKYLQSEEYITEHPEKGRQGLAPPVFLLLSALGAIWNYTDISDKVCGAVCHHGSLLPLLVSKLEEWFPMHLEGVLLVSLNSVVFT